VLLTTRAITAALRVASSQWSSATAPGTTVRWTGSPGRTIAQPSGASA
jgi:hypothetical protein